MTLLETETCKTEGGLTTTSVLLWKLDRDLQGGGKESMSFGDMEWWRRSRRRKVQRRGYGRKRGRVRRSEVGLGEGL